MSFIRPLLLSVFLAAGAAVAGVSSGCAEPAPGETGDEQNITSSGCEVFSAITKKNLTKGELEDLKDPIAQKLLLGEGCPTNLDGILTKLSKTDAEGCVGGGGGGFVGSSSGFSSSGFIPDGGAGRDAGSTSTNAADPFRLGVSTRLVNDSAFLTGKPDGAYRGVMTRDCGKRDQSGLFMSVFGISPEADELPQEQTELIGLDATAGVFNFYVRESRENKWVFMGGSNDGIAKGYDCDEHGACQPKAAKEARCWACHEGGGINMKELRSPWDSWKVGSMPGADEIHKKHTKLGTPQTGIDLEQRVRSGNRRWNAKRVELLKEQGAAEVLRPLFCTLTVNLGSGSVGTAPANFFVSDVLAQGSFGVQMDSTAYAAQLEENNQRVEGRRGALTRDGKVVRDTQTPFRYIEKGAMDVEYVSKLVEQKIIDADFVADVLSINLSRPVFSKTRCDLLAFAPDLEGAGLTAAKIRDGFKANLKKASTPAAAKLLASLENTADAADHAKEVSDFFAACGKRPAQELVADIFQVLSTNRRKVRAHKGKDGAARGQGIIEFSETLPTDDLPSSDKAFNPATCTLK